MPDSSDAGLAADLDALAKATQALQSVSSPPGDRASVPPAPVASHQAEPAIGEEARTYYEHLQQTGQLAEVDEKTDLSKLPAKVTHVRGPDGAIKRIRFSASGVAK